MLNNIKSTYFLKEMISYIPENIKLNLFRYNKAMQNILNINIINYKLFPGLIEVAEHRKMIKYGTEVSTYDDLKLFLRSIEKDLKNAEESRNDSKRLQALLRNELADVPKSEFKSELGKAVKHLMGKEHIVFDNEYIDELKAAIEELKFLIKIVAPNGRIIWNIS